MAERMEVTVNGIVYRVEIDDIALLDGASLEVRVNDKPYTVQLGQAGEGAKVTGKAVEPAPPPPPPAPQPAARPAAKPAATGGKGVQVVAPMPGKILSVVAHVGDQVQAKDTLCTLEAMKMEMSIAAPAAGTVREVRAEVGSNVVYGDLLFVIE